MYISWNFQKNLTILKIPFQFNCIFNSRNRHGGGVAFFIRKEIDFCLINDLEKFNSECIRIKIEINNEETYLIKYYNSPTNDLNIEMLDYIEKSFKNYIICGDLNSKNLPFGCKENNKNIMDLVCDFAYALIILGFLIFDFLKYLIHGQKVLNIFI